MHCYECVFLSVCLLACLNYTAVLHYMLTMVLLYGSFVLRYVLPVLQMASCFCIMSFMARHVGSGKKIACNSRHHCISSNQILMNCTKIKYIQREKRTGSEICYLRLSCQSSISAKYQPKTVIASRALAVFVKARSHRLPRPDRV